MGIYLGIALSFTALITQGIGDYLAKSASIGIGSIRTSFYVRLLGTIPPALIVTFQALFHRLNYDSLDLEAFSLFGPIVAILITLNYVIYYRGLENGLVSIVTTVTSAWFVVSIILAIIFLGESLIALEILLISIILIGIITLSGFRISLIPNVLKNSGATGFSNGFLCMIILGIATILVKPLVESVGPFISSSFTHIVSSMLLFSMLKWRGIPLSFSIKGNMKYVFGAALADSIAIMCFMIAIGLAPISVVAPIVAAHPLVTLTCARVFDGEKTSRLQSVGILLTLGGLILLGLVR